MGRLNSLLSAGIGVAFFCLAYGQALSNSAEQEFSRGVGAYEAKNFVAAMEIWRPLAEAEDVAAQYNLGLLLEFGLGTDRDLSAAVEWYGRAAHGGFGPAQLRIGQLYLDDLWGASRTEDAIYWFKQAAASGSEEALAQLAVLSENDDSYDTSAAEIAKPIKAETQTALVTQPVPRQTSDTLCEVKGDRETDVQVHIEVPPAPVNHGLSISELTHRKFHNEPSGQVLGLMDPDLDIQARARPGITQHRDHVCFWLEEIDVELVYNSIDIFIAREYKGGSCEYLAVLDHENKHVDIAKKNLEKYRTKIRYALTSLLIPSPRRPVKVANVENVEPYYEKLFEEVLQPIYEEMWEDLIAAQAAIDTPRSYAKVNARCTNW